MQSSDTRVASGLPARLASLVGLTGFLIYGVAAPHSIAISWIGISLIILAWLVRVAATRRLDFQRSAVDLPLWLFIGWTVLSCCFSIEPGESLPKLVNVATFLLFYLTQSMLTRKTAVLVVCLMIASAGAGVVWGAAELLAGRGVIITKLSDDSPLRSGTPVAEGDVVWRINGQRVSSVDEIDRQMKNSSPNAPIKLSVISHGEHVEWVGPVITESERQRPSPSGITGGG